MSANERARKKRHRRRHRRFEADPELARHVEARLKANDSPVTICRQLPRKGTVLRDERIYPGVYANGRRGPSSGLHVHLHRRRRRRRPRCRGGAPAVQTSPLGTLCLIHARPEIAACRSEAGHIEGDPTTGALRASPLVALLDRANRFNLLRSLPDGQDSTEVPACLIELLDKVLPELRRTLTCNQGRAMAHWRDLQHLSGIHVYFCEPHKPWQRPSNEAFNGLLRCWLPKRTGLNVHDQDDLDAISRQINAMPRRSLNWHTVALGSGC